MGRLSALPPRIGPLAAKVRPLPKLADALYRSPEWRALVRQVKASRGCWCCVCGGRKRIVADHIVEVKDGGAQLDPANIQLLCHQCHQRKTAQERARRAQGKTGGRMERGAGESCQGPPRL